MEEIWHLYMSHSLNSLKGVYIGIIYGTTIGVIKGDTRSLDYSSYLYALNAIWVVVKIMVTSWVP